MPTLPVPASVDLALWLGAVLRGSAVLDQLVDAMRVHAQLHVVVSGGETGGWWELARESAATGGTGAVAALPVPGDLAGLAGPRELNEAAMEAGEAVLLTGAGRGLVPAALGEVMEWHAHPATPARPLDPLEAGRTLDRALLAALDRLEELQVQSWDGELGDTLGELRHPPDLAWPPDLPAKLAGNGVRAVVCDRIVALALRTSGGSLSAWELGERDRALTDLARAARHSLAAVTSWVPAPSSSA